MDKRNSKTAPKEIFSIEASKILPNPHQPRKIFVDESILRLADSIRQYGIMQPLTVRRVGEEYELISGERRLRAAKELGMQYVPCIIAQASERDSAEMAIIENLLRQDLNIFEEAQAIEALLDSHSLTQEEIAKKLSVSQSYIANKLRLLRLSANEKERILVSGLTERHARALLKIYNEKQREKILDTIITQGLNVARSEELIEKTLSCQEEAVKKRTYKTIGSFYETLSRAIAAASSSGIKIKSRKIENDDYTELTILIPKDQACAEQNNAVSDVV